jgi:hypothetical protein
VTCDVPRSDECSQVTARRTEIYTTLDVADLTTRNNVLEMQSKKAFERTQEVLMVYNQRYTKIKLSDTKHQQLVARAPGSKRGSEGISQGKWLKHWFDSVITTVNPCKAVG